MTLISYKIKIPTKKDGLWEIKEDVRLVETDNWDVAKMEIQKRFPSAHDFVDKTIRM